MSEQKAVSQAQDNRTVVLAGSVDARYQEFKKYIELAEEKTVITLLEKLVDPNILEFITEYPSTAYTKEMTKLMTYVVSYMQVYNMDMDDDDDVIIIREMCKQFMLKMTSHKRRRSHELVNGASRQNVEMNVLNEHKGIRRLLGMNR
jgi:hypothetical protein